MTGEVSSVDREIEDLLRDTGSFPTSIHQATANYLFELAKKVKPGLVVEIGCFAGFSTLHIAKALQSNSKGFLCAFDLATDKARNRIERAGMAALVSFFEGNSAVVGKKVMQDLDRKIDILFIDGDHTRRGCMRDLETFLPYLNSNGVVVFHDTLPASCCWLGPRYAIDQLRGATSPDGRTLFAVEELQIEDPYGVAVCRKLSDGPVVWQKSCSGFFLHLWSTSRLAQFIEIAWFAGKKTPLQIIMWGLSKWRRIRSHW